VKKISCVGYHGTGSGAVEDFLREFNNIAMAKYGVESRFLQDPDGISDLEYNLVENPHRLNSGFALKRFLLFAKAEERSYRHIFGKRWMEWAREYVEALSEFSYTGYWHGDIRIVSPFRLFVYKARKAINMVMPKKFKKNKYYNYFKNIETYYVDLSEEQFLDITQKYCEELCELLNKENKEYVILDQVVSPTNVQRYSRYVKDLKVIVVDRDPRDVYLNDVVKNKNFVLPKELDKFCKVFRMSRQNVAEDGDNVLRVNFEDMIFKYDETTEKIMEFLGLSKEAHVAPKTHFNPNVSVVNTKIWEKNDDYREMAEYIEKELPEYIYDMPEMR